MIIKRVLFPTDFSESADAALAQALFYAEQFDAELHVLHSLCWHEPESIMSSMQTDARKMIDEALSRHAGDGESRFAVHKCTMVGNATADNILAYTEENQIDLIVMGTHGRGIRHMLLGSVAEEVARLAPCPVLTVRAGAGRIDTFPPKNILVPFDFCAESGYALAQARALAMIFAGGLNVLNVISDYYYTNELSGATISLRDLVPDVEAQHITLLEHNADRAGGPSVPTVFMAEMGSPVNTIVKTAEEQKIDLIIMGTHGRGGLGHLLLGSTTERVIRLAPCPVFSLKTSNTKRVSQEP